MATVRDFGQSADQFMADCLERLRKVHFADIASWPEYPAVLTAFLDVPDELSMYRFTLMKEKLPTGEFRIAMQRFRKRLFGLAAEVAANGFMVAPNGWMRPLSEQEIWELT